MDIYSSEYFPTNIEAEQFYREDYGFITSKSVADKFRYLNSQYQNMLHRNTKKNVSNYKIFTEFGYEAEFLNLQISKRLARENGDPLQTSGDLESAMKKYGFIEKVDHSTGEIVFKTSGYGRFTQEERIKMLGIRDAMLKNWAMSETKWNTFVREAGNNNLRSAHFIKNHPTLKLETFEKLNFFFNTREWNRLRKQKPYTESLEDIIEAVESKLKYDNYGNITNTDEIERLILNSDSVQDLLDKIG